MFVPSHFAEARIDVLHALVRARPFGVLVTVGPDGLRADHLPFELDAAPAPYGTLRAHVARGNPLWQDTDPTAGALVTFTGPDAYVAPSWSPSKHATERVVPTWNYAAVHATGPLHVIDDATWLRGLVGRLTDRHEAGRPAPWRVTDAPADFLDRMLQAIVGIEIPITTLIGKWKVSQNRSDADRAGIAAGLRADDAGALAALVEERP